MTARKSILFFLIPFAVSLILHFRVFKMDLVGYHVWRQTQTQTVIYNFSFSDNNILHPRRFDITSGTTLLLYEFPLYQWTIAQYNNLCGYSVTHTRAITFIIFGIFLLGFYKLLRLFVSIEVALITNALICFSPLLYYYCVNPLPDLLALCFSAWCLFFFFRFFATDKIIHLSLFGLFLTLASLVKLPYILFGGVAIPYFYNLVRQKNYTNIFKFMVVFVMLLPVALWYAMAVPTWGTNPVAGGMLGNNKTLIQLLDYLQFTIISSVPELLTNYASFVFLVTGIVIFFKRKLYSKAAVKYFSAVFILFGLYYLFEMNMIEKTHDYYLMPFVLLIFLVVAAGVKAIFNSRYRLFVFFVVCLVPLTAWLRINTRWNLDSPGFNAGYMVNQQALQEAVPPDGICVVDNDESKFIALYYLKRKGFSLGEGELNAESLGKSYRKGARYLVTENVNFDPGIYGEFNFTELYTGYPRIYHLSLKHEN